MKLRTMSPVHTRSCQQLRTNAFAGNQSYPESSKIHKGHCFPEHGACSVANTDKVMRRSKVADSYVCYNKLHSKKLALLLFILNTPCRFSARKPDILNFRIFIPSLLANAGVVTQNNPRPLTFSLAFLIILKLDRHCIVCRSAVASRSSVR